MTAIIALLGSFSGYIPILLDVVGWVINLFGANSQNLAAYQKMIDEANAAGDLSVQAHDRLQAHQAAILARQAIKGDQGAHEKLTSMLVKRSADQTAAQAGPNEKS